MWKFVQVWIGSLVVLPLAAAIAWVLIYAYYAEVLYGVAAWVAGLAAAIALAIAARALYLRHGAGRRSGAV